jgi:hypothetical protein
MLTLRPVRVAPGRQSHLQSHSSPFATVQPGRSVERQALSVSVRTRVGATIPDLESEVVALKGDVTCASSSSNDVLSGRVSGAAFATRGSAEPRSRARVAVWVTARRTMTGQTGTPMDGRLSAVALVRMAWKRSTRVPPVCSRLRRPGSPCIVCNSLDAGGRGAATAGGTFATRRSGVRVPLAPPRQRGVD